MAKLKQKKGGRSDFRAEFYSEITPEQRQKAAADRRAEAARRRRKTSIALPMFGLCFLLCVIAVAGSSAMIWLRKIGTLFGVEWSGDG